MINYFIPPDPIPMIYNPMHQGTLDTNVPANTPTVTPCGCGGQAIPSKPPCGCGGHSHESDIEPSEASPDFPPFFRIGEWLILAILVLIVIAVLKFILGK